MRESGCSLLIVILKIDKSVSFAVHRENSLTYPAQFQRRRGPSTPRMDLLRKSIRSAQDDTTLKHSVRRGLPRLRRQRSVGFRTTVAIELPNSSDFLDHVEIEIGDQHFIFITTGLRDDLAARIAEITLAVKFANIPWRFRAHAIDRAHKIPVGGGMGRLFEFPQMFGKTRDGCGRIENNFRAI